MIPAFAFLALLVSIGLSLSVGASQGFDPQVFWLLRLPRTLIGIAVGGGLAVAGTVIQASLGNPLAEPYTIGVASAAALGAVVGTVLAGSGRWGLGNAVFLASSTVFAFFFAMGSLFVLGSWLRRSFRHSSEVLLTGVVAGLFFASLATLILALSDPASWSSSMNWILGSLGNPSLVESSLCLALMLVALLVAWFHWKPLDLISVDELSAEVVGVDVARFRRRLFYLVAAITAVCVSLAGVIGFLGLLVPHILRVLSVRAHRVLIPTAFVAGAATLLFSDVLARTAARPSELPVGVVMALIGAPVFLALFSRRRA